MTFLKLVQHRDVEFVNETNEDCREGEHFQIHILALEGCFFFLIEVKGLLRLFVHLFVSTLFSQISLLPGRKLRPVAGTATENAWVILLVLTCKASIGKGPHQRHALPVVQ